MNIAERVQELLQKPEYNEKGQNEIAMEIGIAPSVLSRVKNGDSKDPSASTVVAMAKYFNVSADYLLGLSDIKSTDVETQDICQKIGCTDEMLDILQSLFRKFSPSVHIDKNSKTEQIGDNVEYIVLRSFLSDTDLIYKISASIYEHILGLMMYKGRVEKAEIEFVNSNGGKYSLEEIPKDLFEIEEQYSMQKAYAEQSEYLLFKKFMDFLNKIKVEIFEKYYFVDGAMYDKATKKKVSDGYISFLKKNLNNMSIGRYYSIFGMESDNAAEEE